LPLGSVVGRYVILERIGQGGMGLVYKAYDPELDRQIAIKILSVPLDEIDSRVQLLREAQALAQLSHPNVCAIFDVGTLQDSVFIAMELIVGKTLRQWLAEKSRAWKEILAVHLAAGQGLSAAHMAGLVHRDFKPDNVIIGDDGRVRVLDFGLARAVRQPRAAAEPDEEPLRQAVPSSSTDSLLSSDLTEQGSTRGTPSYMAPEHHLGIAVDARTDQFSFCVTLYESLYGEKPFSASSREEYKRVIAMGKINEPPPHGSVPVWLRRVLLRGLSVEPASRYPSMETLIAELRKDPAIRLRRILVASALWLFLVAASVSVWQSLSAQSRLCQGGQQRLSGVWDASVRKQLEDAFRRSDRPFVGNVQKSVEQMLDQFSADWVAMLAEACAATRIRGEQSEELYQQREQCLKNRLGELKALVAKLSRPDPRALTLAVQATSALEPVTTCADLGRVSLGYKRPKDGRVRAEADEIQTQLTEAKTLMATGYPEEATEVARAALAKAKQAGAVLLQAEALYRLGVARAACGDPRAAEAALKEATWKADAEGHDQLRARADAALLALVGAMEGREGEGQRMGRKTLAVLERLGEQGELRASWHLQMAELCRKQKDLDAAAWHLTQALSYWERERRVQPLAPAEALDRLARVAFERGQRQSALEYLGRSLAIREESLGERHPAIAETLWALGQQERERGKNEAASRHLARARDIWKRELGTEHWSLSILDSLGI